MARLAALATCLVVLGACDNGPVSPHLGSEREPILRGHPASASEHWGTVALLAKLGNDEWLCTGTLIAPRLVVTAGHCVKDEYGDGVADRVVVIAGATDVDNAAQGQVYEATRFVPHPRALQGDDSDDPTGLGADYDIAIVETGSDITQVKPVPVLELARVDQVLADGSELIIAGYGTRVIDARGISDEDGEHYVGLQHFVRRSDSEFLAGNSKDSDTCPGDSGGPAYLMVDGEAFLVGATSRGRYDFPNVDCGEGGVYTLVPAFQQWIDENRSTPTDPPGDGDGDLGDGDTGNGDGDAQADAGTSEDDAGVEGDRGDGGMVGSQRRRRDKGCAVSVAPTGSSAGLLSSLGALALALAYRRAKPGQSMSK